MKKGSKICKICDKFTTEPMIGYVKWVKISLCHVCWVHIKSTNTFSR